MRSHVRSKDRCDPALERDVFRAFNVVSKFCRCFSDSRLVERSRFARCAVAISGASRRSAKRSFGCSRGSRPAFGGASPAGPSPRSCEVAAPEEVDDEGQVDASEGATTSGAVDEGEDAAKRSTTNPQALPSMPRAAKSNDIAAQRGGQAAQHL